MSCLASSPAGFDGLGLPSALLDAVASAGYTEPSPIQWGVIPALLSGRDVLGQAQTGTGKTAAFALPLLAQLDLHVATPQVLVLAPTRELAQQVAEAFRSYGANLRGLEVAAVVGGQDFRPQLRQLKQGAHVVVGTPGRVIDHAHRGTLKFEGIAHVVLDEADEMLRMGFIDDVEWLLGETPATRQTALFSATMPAPIRRIAERHLRSPEVVMIKDQNVTAATVRQRYIELEPRQKVDAMVRLLEAEPVTAALVFVRTRADAAELAEKLGARGYAAECLHGDMAQHERDATVARLKSGKTDMVVATDVAARGLDVRRVSHVFNFDMPGDTEAYVHRIGRTGRAGVAGEAILFVTRQDRRQLAQIQRSTKGLVERMTLPTAAEIATERRRKLKDRILETVAQDDGDLAALVQECVAESGKSAVAVAAAMAGLLQTPEPELLPEPRPARRERKHEHEQRPARRDHESRPARQGHEQRPAQRDYDSRSESRQAPRPDSAGMEAFRVEVGLIHGVRPKNLVGAIANEAGLSGRDIGPIEIFDEWSSIELPEGMPDEVFRCLQRVWVCNQQLKLRRLAAPVANERRDAPKRRFRRERRRVS